ncbi:MAG: ATP-dependent zinc metalloprotease FtsH [Phycisphaerae bacterium]|nr:ATP-dependent zinc metalloprotease FtsH [Phycisphaerae bacterium]
MTVSFDTFEHFKERGLASRRRGDYRAARVYLLQAAKAMTELAESVAGELRAERRRTAARLLELARDCERMGERDVPAAGRRGGQAGSRAPVDARGEDSEATPEDWVLRERPTVSFDDVAGLDEAKAEIRMKMIYPVAQPALAERFGVRAGGGLLLYGPPGCGKTMIARAVAGELEATFFAVSPAQILSKWVGQAEQNVQRLFAVARAEPAAVIFIDEIEALVPRRAESAAGGSAVMSRVVPQILTEMEGVGGRSPNPLLFLAATNEPAAMDPAVLRPGRFDEKVYIPLPDAPARYRMLELFLAPRPLADDVDLGALCDRLEGFSGADIRRVCERAATIPFLEAVNGQAERTIAWADIEQVLSASRPSVTPAMLARYDRFAARGE